jgi:signal transduction histidine kinase
VSGAHFNLHAHASANNRRLQVAISAACVAPAVLFVLQSYVTARLNGRASRWQDLVFSAGDWLVLALLVNIPGYLGRRFRFQHTASAQLLLAHAGGVVSLAISWASFGILLGFALHRFPAEGPLAHSFFVWLAVTFPFAAIIYLAVLGIVYAYGYFVEAREREADAARLSAQLSGARLEALRMQLNPHFLFNSLNTVLILVRDKETGAASRVLELLADVLRQVLDTTRSREVPLADELGFIERYLAIEQVRFSDRMNIDWAIEADARSALVPDLIMQPLVENAVRHGVARRAEAGSIIVAARILGDSLELSVRDNGPGIEQPDLEGVGLSNTRERLQTLYGDAASVTINRPDKEGTEVVLRLPHRRSIA